MRKPIVNAVQNALNIMEVATLNVLENNNTSCGKTNWQRAANPPT